MLKSYPLLFALILTLKHYGTLAYAQNANNQCARSQNQSLGDRGTIDVNFTRMNQYPNVLPFQCNFTIRSNRSVLLFWYDISKEFQGDFENCNETKNIIKIYIGCHTPKVYCITNYNQTAFKMLSRDGCFDIHLSTMIDGFVFYAAYYNKLLRDYAPYDDELSRQFFSNYLVMIIIIPIVILIAVIGITFAMMRQAQHSRMVDALQSQQKLLHYQQQASTSTEAHDDEWSTNSLRRQHSSQQNWQNEFHRYSLNDNNNNNKNNNNSSSQRTNKSKRASYLSNRSSRYMTTTNDCISSRPYSASETTLKCQVNDSSSINMKPSCHEQYKPRSSSSKALLSLNDDNNQIQQQLQTNFIENPLGDDFYGIGIDQHTPSKSIGPSQFSCTPGSSSQVACTSALTIPPLNLISLQEGHRIEPTKRESKYSHRLSRLSSLDSLFDENLLLDCDDEDQSICMNPERNDLYRTESQDSYFDKM